MTKVPSILVGVAGEYFVAGELSRRRFITSITMRNSEGMDILVSNQGATRQVVLQVKPSHASVPPNNSLEPSRPARRLAFAR